MSILADLRRAFGPMPLSDKEVRRRALAQALDERMESRAIDSFTSYPGFDEQMLAAQGLHNRPWRAASIREALGVPSIFRAVALISNTTGSLAVEAYRKGVLLSSEDTPRIVQRPDPFRIPRDFYRDTAYDLAVRGEFWWWIAARGADDEPLSLIRIPPWQITLEETNDRLRPRILWNNREMNRDDIRHGTFFLDDTTYRGVGPLQLCGAAVSVAVESQEWAANFFGDEGNGGRPSLIIKARGELSQDPETGVHEADTLRSDWMARANNTPRVIDDGIESVEEFGVNPNGAQMLDAREHNKGDAANMFGIPGALLEYGRAGSSLTYQNITDLFTQFVKAPLAPDYLEPIEQHLSDLLTRSTVARFNVKGIQRADQKTRWEVYKLAVDVLGPEEAAEMARLAEGITPGDIEYAPVPLQPPAAIPSSLPVENRSAESFRCEGKRVRGGIMQPCGKLLAADWRGKCPRCKRIYGEAA